MNEQVLRRIVEQAQGAIRRIERLERVESAVTAPAHDILSTVHTDADETDVPNSGDVLTWNGSQWDAQAPAAGGANKPYATIVVAASNSTAADAANADYVCTGTNDHTTINTAISAATVGGRVLLLEGTYLIAGSITMADDITLEGQGWGTVLQVASGHNANLSVITGSSIARCAVKNLRIHFNGSAQSSGTYNGIAFTGVTRSRIENVRIHENRGFGDGIQLYSASDKNVITGCSIETVDDGVIIYQSDANIITGNEFYDFSPAIYILEGDRNVITNNYCGDVVDSDVITVEFASYNTIEGNILYNADVGVEVSGLGGATVGNTVTGNVIYDMTSYCVVVRNANAQYNIVSDNVCIPTATGNTGIYVENATHTTVTGNVCYDGGTGGFGGSGVHLYGATHTAVSDNVLDTFRYGLFVENAAQYLNISGNVILACSDHGMNLAAISDSIIQANSVIGCSQRTDDTFDGIFMAGDSDTNKLSDNMVRHGGGAAQHRYGLNISAATCDDNIVDDNDLRNSGKTASINDAGTGTLGSNWT